MPVHGITQAFEMVTSTAHEKTHVGALARDPMKIVFSLGRTKYFVYILMPGARL